MSNRFEFNLAQLVNQPESVVYAILINESSICNYNFQKDKSIAKLNQTISESINAMVIDSIRNVGFDKTVELLKGSGKYKVDLTLLDSDKRSKINEITNALLHNLENLELHFLLSDFVPNRYLALQFDNKYTKQSIEDFYFCLLSSKLLSSNSSKSKFLEAFVTHDQYAYQLRQLKNKTFPSKGSVIWSGGKGELRYFSDKLKELLVADQVHNSLSLIRDLIHYENDPSFVLRKNTTATKDQSKRKKIDDCFAKLKV